MSIGNVAQKTNQGVSKSRTWLNDRANVLLAPKQAEGISGFIFDIPDSESINLSSDVTDHYTENNSFINDHIVNKPITITLSGFVGELVYRKEEGVSAVAQELQNRLDTVEAYLGDKTPGFIQQAQGAISQAQTVIDSVNQTLDRFQNTVGLLEGDETPEPTAQQKAYQQLKTFWQQRNIVTVQTPWDYFDSMVITSIGVTQDGASRQISDITVSLKEFRTAETKIATFDPTEFSRQEVQTAEPEDQGNVRGTDGELTSGLYDVGKATGKIQ